MGLTTIDPPTTTHYDNGYTTRLDLISVAIIGAIIALGTMICCFVGMRRKKVLPNESTIVDVTHADGEMDQSNPYAAELRHPRPVPIPQNSRGPRTPDSPPPTYSVLERQMSFTSQISQSSSQIEIPPNYEEAAGLPRQSLMSTLIPEEGFGATTIVVKDSSHRRSDSAFQPSKPKRTHRSKSDIEKARSRRAHQSVECQSPPVDFSAIFECGNDQPDILMTPITATLFTEPLLTSPQIPHDNPPVSQPRESSNQNSLSPTEIDPSASARRSKRNTRASTDV